LEAAGGLASEPLARILVAALAGMLIGIEREKARAALARSRRRRPGPEELVVKEFPGLRTFTLVAVYTSLVSYLWDSGLIPLGLALAFIGLFGAVVVVFSAYRLVVARMAGITTIIVLFVDMAIGVASGVGEILLAASTAVLTAFLLAIKLPAEQLVGRIMYEELLWALELGVVLVVIGPFFYASEASFYGVSLRSLYLFFALVLATSYMGYVLARLRGSEGIAYAAFFGGLAHSEAAMLSLLQILGSRARSLAFHIAAIVNTSMVLRNTLIAIVVAGLAGLEPHSLAALLAAAALASLPGLASWSRLRVGLGEVRVEIENPLRFSAALRSTLLYLGLALASYLARRLGHGSLMAVALVGGFVSSSAAIVAVVPQAPQEAAVKLALAATAAGLLNKPFYAYTSGVPGAARAAAAASLVQALLLALGAAALYM